MFSEKQKTAPHPFHVKSGNWQPLPQPSAALEQYLQDTKTRTTYSGFYTSTWQYVSEQTNFYPRIKTQERT